jgi:DNA-binding transcriptional MerR regulator
MVINQVSKKYKISVRTLRYYEEFGILHPRRLENNIRDFDKFELDKLELILIFKSLNLKLKDIKSIINSCSNIELKRILYSELADVENLIHDLTNKRQLLRSLLKTYGSSDITRHSVEEFIKEQLYFTNKNERVIDMLASTQNIVLEIGKSLIPSAVNENGPSLISSIKELRNSLSQTHGLGVDLIRVRDNINDLTPYEFQIIQNDTILIRKTIKSDSIPAQIDQIISNLKAILL